MTDGFIDECSRLRKDVLTTEKDVWQLRLATNDVTLQKNSDKGEMIANIMLAYRHLEDARRRIGKAIQAYDGGTSVYPE